MKLDIVLAGVGGQGVVSVGVVVAAAAQEEGYTVRLSEVHGMAQRGGSVMATLRIADQRIHGALVPNGTADFIVATEPLEGLRHLALLAPKGMLVTASEPLINMTGYPSMEEIEQRLEALPSAVVVDAQRLAKEAGNPRAINVVLVGALSAHLPLDPAGIESYVSDRFASKGDEVVASSLRAFRAGRESACSTAA